jgi:small subunit ribosomal protein S4
LKGERCYNKCPIDSPTGVLAPGQHGKRNQKKTEYGKRLREKQKTKRIAGLLERSFYRYFETAQREPGRTGESLLRSLETRLDNVVRRLGFAPSMANARQLVMHGHILVNGTKVNIPSASVKAGDVVSLAEGMKSNVRIQRSISNQIQREVPSWLELEGDVIDALGRSKDLPVDLKDIKVQGQVRVAPSREEMSYPVNEQYIVELYSK